MLTSNIIFGILMFLSGSIVSAFILASGSDGDIIVQDDELYLNISSKGMDKIKHSKKFVTFVVKRR